MAVYQRDLLFIASLYKEATFGAGITPLTRYTRRYNWNDAEPSYTPDREGVRSCGGEFDDAAEDARWNSELPLNTDLFPDAGTHLLTYALGGGSAYTVSGSGPYVHTIKRIQPPATQQDSLAVCVGYEGTASTFLEYRGGIVAEVRAGGTVEGDRRCKLTGRIIFNGNRVAVPTLVVPACAPEKPYRFAATAVQFGPYGGADYSDLKVRSCYFTLNNNVDDEPELSGLYAITREHGEREFGAELEIIGQPNDAIDQAYVANTEHYLIMTMTHSDAGIEMIFTMPKCYISSIEGPYATRLNKRVHRITLRGLKDDTAIADSPWYVESTTDTASYRAA